MGPSLRVCGFVLSALQLAKGTVWNPAPQGQFCKQGTFVLEGGLGSAKNSPGFGNAVSISQGKANEAVAAIAGATEANHETTVSILDYYRKVGDNDGMAEWNEIKTLNGVDQDGNNEVYELVLDAQGAGYLEVPKCTLTANEGQTGKDAECRLVLGKGPVKKIVHREGGSGYTSNPTCKIIRAGGIDSVDDKPENQATCQAEIEPKSVKSVELVGSIGLPANSYISQAGTTKTGKQYVAGVGANDEGTGVSFTTGQGAQFSLEIEQGQTGFNACAVSYPTLVQESQYTEVPTDYLDAGDGGCILTPPEPSVVDSRQAKCKITWEKHVWSASYNAGLPAPGDTPNAQGHNQCDGCIGDIRYLPKTCEITDPGHGYESNGVLTGAYIISVNPFSPPGFVAAEAEAHVNSNVVDAKFGTLSHISITNGGTGYNNPPVCLVTSSPAAETEFNAYCKAKLAKVKVIAVHLISGGAEYSNHPTVEISPPDGYCAENCADIPSCDCTAQIAQATALVPLHVASIKLEKHGSGYKTPPIVGITPANEMFPLSVWGEKTMIMVNDQGEKVNDQGETVEVPAILTNIGEGAKATAILPPNDFGYSVALENEVLVVGAPAEQQNRGSVYVFYKNYGGPEAMVSKNAWGKKAKIVGLTMVAGAYFGRTVALSGEYIAVGAPQMGLLSDDNEPLTNAGVVTLFKKDESGPDRWGQFKTISEKVAGLWLGASLSFSGRVLVVGAPRQTVVLGDTCVDTPDFETVINDESPPLKCKAADADDTLVWTKETCQQFTGEANLGPVANCCVCGEKKPGISYANAGAVKIYERDEGGMDHFGLVKTITAPVSAEGGASSLAANDYFGDRGQVSATQKLDAAGETVVDTLIAVSTVARNNNRGKVYVFSKNTGLVGYESQPSTARWGLVSSLDADTDPLNPFPENIYYGDSVAISGTTVAVTAFQAPVGTGANMKQAAGKVYVFNDVDTKNPKLITQLVATNSYSLAGNTEDENLAKENANFGQVVAFSGKYLAVGTRKYKQVQMLLNLAEAQPLTGLAVEDISHASVKATWTAPSLFDGEEVEQYKVQIHEAAGGASVDRFFLADGQGSILVDQLKCNTQYRIGIQVRRKDACGYSEARESDIFRTLPCKPVRDAAGGPPLATFTGENGVVNTKLSFQNGDIVNGPIAGGFCSSTTTADTCYTYHVYYETKEMENPAELSIASVATSTHNDIENLSVELTMQQGSLKFNTMYKFFVVAKFNGKAGPPSELTGWVNSALPTLAVPEVVNLGDRLHVSWKAPSGDVPVSGYEVTEYAVSGNGAGVQLYNKISVAPDVTFMLSYHAEGLNADRQYSVALIRAATDWEVVHQPANVRNSREGTGEEGFGMETFVGPHSPLSAKVTLDLTTVVMAFNNEGKGTPQKVSAAPDGQGTTFTIVTATFREGHAVTSLGVNIVDPKTGELIPAEQITVTLNAAPVSVAWNGAGRRLMGVGDAQTGAYFETTINVVPQTGMECRTLQITVDATDTDATDDQNTNVSESQTSIEFDVLSRPPAFVREVSDTYVSDPTYVGEQQGRVVRESTLGPVVKAYVGRDTAIHFTAFDPDLNALDFEIADGTNFPANAKFHESVTARNARRVIGTNAQTDYCPKYACNFGEQCKDDPDYASCQIEIDGLCQDDENFTFTVNPPPLSPVTKLKCTDWKGECHLAVSKYDYPQESEDDLKAHCPVSCMLERTRTQKASAGTCNVIDSDIAFHSHWFTTVVFTPTVDQITDGTPQLPWKICLVAKNREEDNIGCESQTSSMKCVEVHVMKSDPQWVRPVDSPQKNYAEFVSPSKSYYVGSKVNFELVVTDPTYMYPLKILGESPTLGLPNNAQLKFVEPDATNTGFPKDTHQALNANVPELHFPNVIYQFSWVVRRGQEASTYKICFRGGDVHDIRYRVKCVMVEIQRGVYLVPENSKKDPEFWAQRELMPELQGRRNLNHDEDSSDVMTLMRLAEEFDTDILSLQMLNHLPNGDALKPGTPINVGVTYTVRPGDTLEGLAERFGLKDVDSILALNPDVYTDVVTSQISADNPLTCDNGGHPSPHSEPGTCNCFTYQSYLNNFGKDVQAFSGFHENTANPRDKDLIRTREGNYYGFKPDYTKFKAKKLSLIIPGCTYKYPQLSQFANPEVDWIPRSVPYGQMDYLKGNAEVFESMGSLCRIDKDGNFFNLPETPNAPDSVG